MGLIKLLKKALFAWMGLTIVVIILSVFIDGPGSSSNSDYNDSSNVAYVDDYEETYQQTTGYDPYVSDPYVEEDPYVSDPYIEDEPYVSAPVTEEVRGANYLGSFTTADGTSDITFYISNGQRYYYGTIYGTYCEGTAEYYESHGAIYCLDASRADGTVAVSFYTGYNPSNEMSPYELYEQVYGTGFYWHH